MSTQENRPLTSEEHEAKRQAIIAKIKEMYPESQFNMGKWSTELVYYTARVRRSKIVITKKTRRINSYPHHSIGDAARIITNNLNLTEQAARAAIGSIMNKALAHFETCLKEYRDLTKRLSFSVGFNYDGDGYSIFDEYEYISFQLNGFNFQFEIK